MADEKTKKDKVPPATFSADPDENLEKKLREHPHDKSAKVDVASDESMDASDPSSASQPGSSTEPPPSSGYPK